MSHRVDQVMKRPANYADLSGVERWAIDRQLGVLDWDPTNAEVEEYKRRTTERESALKKRWYDKPCCFTCAHWEEKARATMASMIAEWTKEGCNLGLLEGSSEEGECADGVDGVNIRVYGDASVDITTDANFHCPGFKART